MRLADLPLFAALCACLAPLPASAQNQGFELNRLEPTAPGEWFFAVEHPWYSRTRRLAVGLSLGYAHKPLIVGLSAGNGDLGAIQPIISDELGASLQIAGSFLNRVTLTAALPIVFFEGGNPAGGISPASGAVSDPRLTGMVRLFGAPERESIALSAGLSIYVPLRAFSGSLPAQSSDQAVRVLPRLILTGLRKSVRWSIVGGFLYRPDATLGQFKFQDGSTTGSEVQFKAAVGYANEELGLTVGPELLLATGVTGDRVFRRDYTSLEVLFGAQVNILRLFQVGVGLGFGALRQPGTPDFRLIIRVAYAPIRVADRDGDGIRDVEDACPDEAGVPSSIPSNHGCPPVHDRDCDGYLDEVDLCPDVPAGELADPRRRGCPADRDGDGIPDAADLCPDQAAGKQADPRRPGCPPLDQDGDGISDAEDLCPHEPAGPHPDPRSPGCPLSDRDGDGIPDDLDACPDSAAGVKPNPALAGCPLATDAAAAAPVAPQPTEPAAPAPVKPAQKRKAGLRHHHRKD